MFQNRISKRQLAEDNDSLIEENDSLMEENARMQKLIREVKWDQDNLKFRLEGLLAKWQKEDESKL